MSLLSKQDRDLAIEALEFYLKELGDLPEAYQPAEKISRLWALRNWIIIRNSRG